MQSPTARLINSARATHKRSKMGTLELKEAFPLSEAFLQLLNNPKAVGLTLGSKDWDKSEFRTRESILRRRIDLELENIPETDNISEIIVGKLLDYYENEEYDLLETLITSIHCDNEETAEIILEAVEVINELRQTPKKEGESSLNGLVVEYLETVV
ncbi:hypothetical protein PCE1_001529 [Barthelona sp. PCE]